MFWVGFFVLFWFSFLYIKASLLSLYKLYCSVKDTQSVLWTDSIVSHLKQGKILNPRRDKVVTPPRDILVFQSGVWQCFSCLAEMGLVVAGIGWLGFPSLVFTGLAGGMDSPGTTHSVQNQLQCRGETSFQHRAPVVRSNHLFYYTLKPNFKFFFCLAGWPFLSVTCSLENLRQKRTT